MPMQLAFVVIRRVRNLVAATFLHVARVIKRAVIPERLKPPRHFVSALITQSTRK
jgi:hypothetical protein